MVYPIEDLICCWIGGPLCERNGTSRPNSSESQELYCPFADGRLFGISFTFPYYVHISYIIIHICFLEIILMYIDVRMML